MRVSVYSTRVLFFEQGGVRGVSSIDLLGVEAKQPTRFTEPDTSRRGTASRSEPGQGTWQVTITRKNGEPITLDLPNIENQPTWTNTLEGAQACVTDIGSIVQSPAALGGGTYDYNELFNRPTFGSAAFLDGGTLPGNLVQLDGLGRLPAVDGSQLTNLPAGGSTTFVGLTDSPGAYAGNAKKVVQVNGAETKLEYGPVLGSAAEAEVSDFDTAGTGAAAAAAAVAAHVAAMDPHGDRAYADSTKLAKSSNLSDVGNAATAFGNIKQAATTSATGVVELATNGETVAGVAVQGDDYRLALATTALQAIPPLDQVLGAGQSTLGNIIIVNTGDSVAMMADSGGGGTLLLGPSSAGSTFSAKLPAQDGTLLLDSDIGTTVQGWDTDLQAIGALTPANDDFIQRKSGVWMNRNIAQVKSDLSLAGSNTGDQTISITGDVTAPGSTGALAATVTRLNGTSLAGLGTGLLKNTTGTGVPSIAIAGTDYLAPAAIGTTVQGFRPILADIGTVFSTSSNPAQPLTSTSYVNLTGASLANVPVGTYLAIGFVTYDAPTIGTGIGLNFASTGSVSDFAILAGYSSSVSDASTAQANGSGLMPPAPSSRATAGNTAMLIGILSLSAVGTVTVQARLELGTSGITVQNVNSMKLIRIA